MDVTSEPYPKRRIDSMSGLMMLVTLAALAGSAWLRFGRSSAPEASTVAVGAEAPPLRLIDPETSEPVVLVGLNSKVVWVVFWSAASPSGRSCLAELEAASKRLRAHRRFAMVTAAVESDDPAAVREAVEAAGVEPAGLPGQPRDPAAVPRRGRRSPAAHPDRRGRPHPGHGPRRRPAHDRSDRRGGPPTPRRARSRRRDAVRFRDASHSLTGRSGSHVSAARCTLAKPSRM